MSRAFRPIAAILSALLLAGTPVQAGPVAIGEVLQIISSSQNPPELRLRSLYHTSALLSGIDSRTISRVKQSPDNGSTEIQDTSVVPLTGSSDSLLSGIAFGQQRGVEIIDQGDVDGTICDCGEITLPGGFPKWPLLLLAGIPLFFIGDRDIDFIPPIVTPTPPPPPNTPVPEPASLLLFGSGLAVFGAGLRRRHAKAKLSAQAQNTEEG
ncbi:MAG: PEP-CTERM sorting domain-containing protein [Pyrinomonadaceae bacterium]